MGVLNLGQNPHGMLMFLSQCVQWLLIRIMLSSTAFKCNKHIKHCETDVLIYIIHIQTFALLNNTNIFICWQAYLGHFGKRTPYLMVRSIQGMFRSYTLRKGPVHSTRSLFFRTKTYNSKLKRCILATHPTYVTNKKDQCGSHARFARPQFYHFVVSTTNIWMVGIEKLKTFKQRQETYVCMTESASGCTHYFISLNIYGKENSHCFRC